MSPFLTGRNPRALQEYKSGVVSKCFQVMRPPVRFLFCSTLVSSFFPKPLPDPKSDRGQPATGKANKFVCAVCVHFRTRGAAAHLQVLQVLTAGITVFHTHKQSTFECLETGYRSSPALISYIVGHHVFIEDSRVYLFLFLLCRCWKI